MSPNSSASNNKNNYNFIALRAQLTMELHSSKETHLRIKDYIKSICPAKAFLWSMPEPVFCSVT